MTTHNIITFLKAKYKYIPSSDIQLEDDTIELNDKYHLQIGLIENYLVGVRQFKNGKSINTEITDQFELKRFLFKAGVKL